MNTQQPWKFIGKCSQRRPTAMAPDLAEVAEAYAQLDAQPAAQPEHEVLMSQYLTLCDRHREIACMNQSPKAKFATLKRLEDEASGLRSKILAIYETAAAGKVKP